MNRYWSIQELTKLVQLLEPMFLYLKRSLRRKVFESCDDEKNATYSLSESSMIHFMRGAIPVIVIGIILWTIALVVAIIANAMAKVIFACILGIVLGLIGIRYTKRRAKREGI
jgi:hypothetical protein